jgi:hypothetical protein
MDAQTGMLAQLFGRSMGLGRLDFSAQLAVSSAAH